MKVILAMVVSAAVFGLAVSAVGQMGVGAAPSYRYGDVTLRHSAAKGISPGPVVFNHWVHRARFSCRLCHTDLGFSMQAGSTIIKAADNSSGKYCGVCHNGIMKFGGTPVFKACSDDPAEKITGRCGRCHGVKDADRQARFSELARKMPQDGSGNHIDWMKAEEEGIIRLVDSLEQVPRKRSELKPAEDFVLDAKLAGIPEIIFSHKKHTVWNGCEICHPDIFGVKRGSVSYTMIEISGGLYCGACHGKVAFPNNDCRKCHLKPMQF